ncbi:hypothetical protein ABET41_10315 [Metabacillus fastidiosus]|uniref:Uncharacterized protein n=1 Tax=Metabacillus fastidiosus TaxID=1458 RepID=A0ABU6NST6_9BACI|nr:hypothetical protein [Metabacillus fastidiosus]MED4452181.1 hypothetical protein [Metabacillus fastidiosus]
MIGIILVLFLSIVYWLLQMRMVYLFVKYGVPVGAIVHIIVTIVFNVFLFIYIPVTGTFLQKGQLPIIGLMLVIWGIVLFAIVFSVPKDLPRRKKGQFFSSEKWHFNEGTGGSV